MRRTPIAAYNKTISGIPLTGGQAQAFIPVGGSLTLTVGPQGLGTVWYAAQVTISTTTGALDTSTALIYQGPASILTPATLVGQVYTGNGTAALALPNMTPGQVVTVIWTNAHPGDTAALNIIGTMNALSTS
jgi:streptogramin lyase